MDKKTIAVIVLGIFAVVLVYYLHMNTDSGYLKENIRDSLTSGREKLNSSRFKENFLEYNCTVILMDIREIEDPWRRNILQCGVDLSGSEALAHMEKQIIGFDEKGCTDENGSKTVQECMQMLKKECYIFYITEGQNTSTVYDGLLIIEEGEVYFPCIISYSVS